MVGGARPADIDGNVSAVILDTRSLEQEWGVAPELLQVATFVEFHEYADGGKAMRIWDRESHSFRRMFEVADTALAGPMEAPIRPPASPAPRA